MLLLTGVVSKHIGLGSSSPFSIPPFGSLHSVFSFCLHLSLRVSRRALRYIFLSLSGDDASDPVEVGGSDGLCQLSENLWTLGNPGIEFSERKPQQSFCVC